MTPMAAPRLHPLVARWFATTLGPPTPAQEEGWEHIAAGRNTLVAAPTGSGKTLAAFLWWVSRLVEDALAGRLEDRTAVVYVSPLKALGNDIQKNLAEPLAAIRALAAAEGLDLPEIRVQVRSGDTPQSERAAMIKRPPHILITTPESLFILLTAESSRQYLSTAGAVIVDEIHAMAGDKRGTHLALSLERLDRLVGKPLQRIGLSATQKPIERIASLLSPSHPVSIVDTGHRREWDLSIEVTSQPLGPIASHEMWDEVYDRIVELAAGHRTTLVFVNTRRLVERVAHQLTTRLGQGKVAAHHGSLSRAIRLEAEQGLKSGAVPVVVATASLELGIDIGHVDLVVHLGPPRALHTLLQRVGRSGHWLGGLPKGVVFALTRDELVQAAAAIRAVRGGELDEVHVPRHPLDIVAQQVVAIAAAEDVGEDDLFALVRRAYPFRELPRREYDQVIEMLSDGVATRHGRKRAHLHRDRINGILRGRRGARLAAITSGGAIPDMADYDVIEEPAETFVGKVNEDFAIESMAGDIFLLGNTSWRIRRIEAGRVRVEDAHGAPPTIPFWLGEAPARTAELSEAVSALRHDVVARMDDGEAAIEWLCSVTAVDRAGAEQIVDYVREAMAVLGALPSTTTVVAERFFDEAGGMQLIMHAPFGAAINRAWGLALRKRFCVTFDFELQAAATDDGIVISLGETHSFPLESVFSFLNSKTVEDVVVQAMLVPPSPFFTNRWRWNASRALALLRHSGGKRVPMPIQRIRAEELLGAVFPEQVQCQENRDGPLEPPDHPLVTETVRNCLSEAMDVEGLKEVLRGIEEGRIRTVAVETPSPSAFSHEILNSNPYAYLDDAPLEERRARAVSLRRTDPDLARGAGALDEAAIDEVRAQAWPDVRTADELHDHLLTVVVLPVDDARGAWVDLVDELVAAGRVTVASWGADRQAYVAAERQHMARAALPSVRFEPEIALPFEVDDVDGDTAIRTIVQGWMQTIGPVTVQALSSRIGLPEGDVTAAMAALESAGIVMQGHYTAGADGIEWCERGLLARIHRLTIGRLRREIEPVTPADLMRFLLRWQHVQPGTQLHGREGVLEVLTQLQGLELPAPAWEERVLPARVVRYDPADLEHLCLSGVVAWGRLRPPPPSEARTMSGPARSTPLGFVLRDDLPLFIDPDAPPPRLVGAAADVAEYLGAHGASFLADISRGAGRLPTEVEDALWELVTAGVVSGDGVAGLRRLLKGGRKARPRPYRLRALPGWRRDARALPVGRWSLFNVAAEPDGGVQGGEHSEAAPRSDTPVERAADGSAAPLLIEAMAGQLLRRYGVVLREVLVREKAAPPWRDLVRVYRRWEAQGQVRGGRFVTGFVGEQFAVAEALDTLRAVRRQKEDPEPVVVSAADPLNLVGIVVPGAKVSRFSGLSIVYHNGVAVDVAPLGTIRSRLQPTAMAAGGATPSAN